jgi:D-serine deaminase-like pyridoxal phosphate-dependent protein
MVTHRRKFGGIALTQLHPDLPALAGIATPALIIDHVALEGNIARMAAIAAEHNVALRPHAKTHKCIEIARMQREAGAIGIACATIREAEALAQAGITGLLITSPLVDRDKAARLACLNRHSPVTAVVDHPAQLDVLCAALAPGDPPLGILIDVDIGQGRTGVSTLQDGHALARKAAGDPRIAFCGLQGYAGHVQHIVDPDARRSATHAAAATLRTLVALLKSDGLPCPIVSGSGTGTHAFDIGGIGGPYTELQVGSYVFMDADYGRVRQDDGSPLPFAPALFVLATVVSANRHGQVTVDAGTKALAVNGPPPARFIDLAGGATYAFAGDEHGIVSLPEGASRPAPGARILIEATHCDPTVNLHAEFHAVHRDGVVATMAIVGRYG